MPPPLAGVRVLDLSWIIAGPLATRFLSDFGADVIKVESAGRMDTGRGNRVPLYGPLPGDANADADAGGYFHDVNAGKRSCTLNLASVAGRALLRGLVAVSDAIVCNLGGDQLERWGVGYEDARAINPGIIVVNMPTMESSGARARWRGFGDMIAGAAGLKSISGYPENPPLAFGHQYADFSGNPFHGAIALLAALHHRDQTGEGQFIEVSQYESTIALMGASILEQSANGYTPSRAGNRDAEAVPHNVYRCGGDRGPGTEERAGARDGESAAGSTEPWCAIAVFTDEQWKALTAIPGLEALRREEYETAAGRRAHEAAIDAVIEAWTVGWEAQALAAYLQERGIPAGPFQSLPELTAMDPVLGGRYFTTIPHPNGREFLVHGNPVQARRHAADVRRAPLLGEHTIDVLQDLLGLSSEELAAYASDGAIE